MELGGLGEAFNFISPGAFSEGFVLRFFQHAINGLEYLHSKGIVHRDLKADNMVLDIRGNVRDCCVCVCVCSVLADVVAGVGSSTRCSLWFVCSLTRAFPTASTRSPSAPLYLSPDLNTAQTL
jgi:serine/threonine protein kinase